MLDTLWTDPNSQEFKDGINALSFLVLLFFFHVGFLSRQVLSMWSQHRFNISRPTWALEFKILRKWEDLGRCGLGHVLFLRASCPRIEWGLLQKGKGHSPKEEILGKLCPAPISLSRLISFSLHPHPYHSFCFVVLQRCVLVGPFQSRIHAHKTVVRCCSVHTQAASWSGLMGQQQAVAAVVFQVWPVQDIPLGGLGLQQPRLLLTILP